MTLYTLRCKLTGESQTWIVCPRCEGSMPAVDGDLVTASPADADLECEVGDRCGPDSPGDGGGAWERRQLGISL